MQMTPSESSHLICYQQLESRAQRSPIRLIIPALKVFLTSSDGVWWRSMTLSGKHVSERIWNGCKSCNCSFFRWALVWQCHSLIWTLLKQCYELIDYLLKALDKHVHTNLYPVVQHEFKRWIGCWGLWCDCFLATYGQIFVDTASKYEALLGKIIILILCQYDYCVPVLLFELSVVGLIPSFNGAIQGFIPYK